MSIPKTSSDERDERADTRTVWYMTAQRSERPLARTLRPSLKLERELIQAHGGPVLGVDEAGRGPGAGGVYVGMVLVEPGQKTLRGLADSKVLSAEMRERLIPNIRAWSSSTAVGSASAGEVDELGIIGALRLAGARAYAEIIPRPAVILLDGNHDWLSPDGLMEWMTFPEVVTVVKADLYASSVSAASVLAKVSRDREMDGLHASYPQYGWDSNRGYLTPAHLAAIREHGLSDQHRKSWTFPL